MAGEPDPSHSGGWQDDPGMGIIPRALQQLFEELEAQVFFSQNLKSDLTFKQVLYITNSFPGG